jgi:hypothetical protein
MTSAYYKAEIQLIFGFGGRTLKRPFLLDQELAKM